MHCQSSAPAELGITAVAAQLSRHVVSTEPDNRHSDRCRARGDEGLGPDQDRDAGAVRQLAKPGCGRCSPFVIASNIRFPSVSRGRRTPEERGQGAATTSAVRTSVTKSECRFV